jgi:Flp pilus assembly protein CpaB
LIQPGDRVDVIADPPKATAEPPPASAILRGVRVLAIGESLEYSSATPSPQEANSTTVTLEVTPKQADLLVMADLNTTLRLALRSPKEPLNSEPTEALHFPSGTVPSISGPAPSVDSPVQAMALALKGLSGPHADPPAASGRGSVDDSPVKVIDGDHYAGQGSGSAIP